MSDTLQEICTAKREHVARSKQRVLLAELESRAKNSSPTRGFHSSLKKSIEAGGIGLIAEIKKASPSRGVIREDFNPETLARAYEEAGATCLSVLTDIPYFQGEDAYLIEAHGSVLLPVLRKDFIIDPYQIIESRALGADCVLLIMACLSDSQARELESLAHQHQMDVLIEVHDAEEMGRALTHLSSRLLGINNRNLKTLAVDLTTSETLRPRVPADYTLICESGIATHADIVRMRNIGIYGFLVGESLMRESDVTAATRRLLTNN
jgi:indole-3-glycerol phosphate synthase